MTLLPKVELIRLVNANHFEIERERREFLIEFMESLSPHELDLMLRCEETPAEEVAFIRACCGLPALDQPLLKSL